MDKRMVPPRTTSVVAGGGSVKPARQGKTSSSSSSPAQAAAGVGESGEVAGGGGAVAAAAAMGLLKRKRTTPPESPAPSKKRTSEEAELPKPSSSEQQQPVEGTPPRKIAAGKSFSSPAGDTARASNTQQLLPGQNEELGPEEAARLRFVKDVDALQNRVPAVVENVSYGQESLFRTRPPSEISGPVVALTKDCEAQSSATPHLVPSHAGWFQWERIHQLERAALPEYFVGKDSKKTPEMYIEQRTCIMRKYRQNPRKVLKFEDVRDLLPGDVSGAVRLFGFLDHWGLVNYQAITDFSPFLSRGQSGSVEETNNGALSASPLVKLALANLFNFEPPALAPAHKPLAISPSPASNLPMSSLAEAAVQESLAAPAVEYHCNSCQADCSKRRYHCQKQADFDLCPDCYNDGKFGHGMSGTDFLRMDALTETADANGGGWSDQETLLLLEALELYGDNWTEIAEHVATKSKAQCILHFIRLPIEDPFLEDMEASSTVLTVRPPATVVSDSQSTSPPKDKIALTGTAQNEHPSSSDSIEAVPSSLGQDASALTETGKKDRPDETRTEKSEQSSPKKEEKDEADVSKVVSKVKVSSNVHPLFAASESAGCAGPDGLIAFADAGNPVMTQVAFLAAMVGPRVAAAAAQAALKSLAEDDPVGFLSVKNSFALDGSDTSHTTLASGSERSSGQQSTEMSLVSSTEGPRVASDSKSTPTGAEEPLKKNADEKVVAGTLEKVAGQDAQTTQKSDGNAPTDSLVAEQDVPSIAKVRTAAANALASAAVKAKLLADQEEREIQRLVAGVIENQLKKLESKLKQFSELESLLGRECEQAEKARAKVYAERARIMASRLGSSNVSQLQSTGTTAASYSKTSSHSVNLAALPRPAVFTFGPTGHSAPAAGYMTTAGLESSSSIAASPSSQQAVTQRPPRAVPGTSLALGAKE